MPIESKIQLKRIKNGLIWIKCNNLEKIKLEILNEIKLFKPVAL